MEPKTGDQGTLDLEGHPLHGLSFELHKFTSDGLAIIRLTEKSRLKACGYNRGDLFHVPRSAFVPAAG